MFIEYNIDLLILNPLINLSFIFTECVNLIEVHNIDKLDTSQEAEMAGMLCGC